MLNDVVEILDARIVNFTVDFMAHVDNRYDSDSVLAECIEAVRQHFEETLYIGEPIYLTKIYQKLNDVDGVVDVKDVFLQNISGNRHSSISLDFEANLSRDGTFIKIPRNVIAELKFPNTDIKGTVK